MHVYLEKLFFKRCVRACIYKGSLPYGTDIHGPFFQQLCLQIKPL